MQNIKGGFLKCTVTVTIAAGEQSRTVQDRRRTAENPDLQESTPGGLQSPRVGKVQQQDKWEKSDYGKGLKVQKF